MPSTSSTAARSGRRSSEPGSGGWPNGRNVSRKRSDALGGGCSARARAVSKDRKLGRGLRCTTGEVAEWLALRAPAPPGACYGEDGGCIWALLISPHLRLHPYEVGWVGRELKEQMEERCFLAWAPNLRGFHSPSHQPHAFPPPPGPTDLDHGSR